ELPSSESLLTYSVNHWGSDRFSRSGSRSKVKVARIQYSLRFLDASGCKFSPHFPILHRPALGNSALRFFPVELSCNFLITDEQESASMRGSRFMDSAFGCIPADPAVEIEAGCRPDSNRMA